MRIIPSAVMVESIYALAPTPLRNCRNYPRCDYGCDWLASISKEGTPWNLNRGLAHTSLPDSPRLAQSGHYQSRALRRKKPEPLRTERPHPNLVYAGAKRKNIFVSPWQRERICDPGTEEERSNSIHALVLKLENRIPPDGHKIAPAMNVIAKLKFRHKNGATERDIDYGVWLNSPSNTTDIGIGDTRELVLVFVVNNKLETFEDRRSDNRYFDSEGFSYFEAADVLD